MTWYVIGVRSGCELRIRDKLHEMQRPALVPIRFAQRRSRGVRWHVRLPVMHGYVFARLLNVNWFSLWQLDGWRGPVRIGDRLMTLTMTEVSSIEYMSQPVQAQVEIKHRPGDEVTVALNHAATLTGLVARIERGQIVVQVEMLGKLHEIAVEERIVEAA